MPTRPMRSETNFTNPFFLLMQFIKWACNNPLLAFALLSAMQVVYAAASPRRETRETDLAEDVLDLNTQNLELHAKDITDRFIAQDITEAYHGRRLQNAPCESKILFPDSWALALGGSVYDRSYDVVVRPDGKVIVVGFTSSFGAGKGDLLLVQFAASGTLEWARTWGGSSEDMGLALALLPDGKVIVTGSTSSFGAGDYDLLLAQFAANGTLEWARTLGGSNRDEGSDLVLRPDGKVLVTGSTWSFGAGANDLLLAQFATNGTLEWARTLGGSVEDVGAALALRPDGKVLVTGSSSSFSAAGVGDLLLAQFAANGTFEWAKTLSVNLYTYGQALALQPDGKVLVTGYAEDKASYNNDLLLAQFANDGTLEWVKEWKKEGTNNVMGSDLVLRPKGKIVVTGSINNYDINISYLLLAQFTADGSLEWAKTLESSGMWGAALACSSDGNIMVAGNINTFDTFKSNVFLAKLSINDDIPTLASGIKFNDQNKLKDVTDLYLLSNVKPSSQLITSINQTILPINASLIYSPTVSSLSLIANTSSFAQLRDPILTLEYIYSLPLQPFVYISSQPQLNVEMGDNDWLSYDAINNRLIGTPITNSPGLISIQLATKGFIITPAGVISGQVQLNLCIKTEGGTWLKSIGTGAGSVDEGIGIVHHPDGKVLVTGQTTDSTGFTDLFLTQFTENGVLEWATTLGGARSDDVRALALSQDGKVLVLGSTDSFGDVNTGLLLAQFSENGALEWARTLGGLNRGGYGTDLALRPDGKILVTGGFRSDHTGNGAPLLAQFSANGTLEWAKTLDSSKSGRCTALALRPDGKILVTGLIQGFSTNIDCLLLAQFTENGAVEWARKIGDLVLDNSNIALKPDGKILVTGNFRANYIGKSALLLAQFSTNGTLEWARTLDSLDSGGGKALALRPDGKILITGSFISGGYAPLLAQFSANGTLEWAKTLGRSNSGGGKALALRPDGKILVTGLIDNLGYSDLLLAQLTAEGELESSNTFIQPIVNVQTSTITPTVFNITNSMQSAVINVSARNLNVSSTAFIPSMYSPISNHFSGLLRPIQAQVFGKLYQLNLKHYLYTNTEVLQIAESNKAFLPSWLKYNAISKVLSGTPTGSVRGRYWITMNLQQMGKEQRASFIIDVLNTPPFYMGNTTLSTPTGRFIFPLSASFIDTESDPIYPYGIAALNGQLPPTIASMDSISGRLFGTALSGDQGHYQFNITAIDSYGALGWQVITINVQNTKPKTNTIFSNPAPVTVGNRFSFDFASNAFVDPDGDAISYSAIYPDFLSFDSNSRTLYGTPQAIHRGIYNFTIIATDPYLGRANVTLPLIVNGIPTQEKALSSLTTSKVGLPYAYTLPAGLFSDPDGDALQYEIIEDNKFIKPSWLNFNSTSQMLSGTPNSNNHQASPIRFKVSDGRGAENYFTVSLSIPNSSPIALTPLANQNINPGQIRTLTVPSQAFFDADGDSLSYRIEEASGNSAPEWVSLTSTAITLAPRTGHQGNYTLRVIANDGYAGEADSTFSVQVINSAPILNEELPEAPVVTVGNRFSYSFSNTLFKDPDGDTLSYRISAPGFLGFNANSRLMSGTPTAADRGKHNVSITARDAFGAANSVILPITVNGIPSQQIALNSLTSSMVGMPYAYTLPAGLFSDPDGDPLSYELFEDIQHIKPNWLNFDSTSRTISGTPNSNNHQASLIRFKVSDGRGAESYFTVTLTIPNSAPQALAIANQTVAIDQVRSLVIGSNHFVDADGDRLSYRIESLSQESQAWLSLSNELITFFPKAGDQGNYTFKLTAFDGYGGEAALSFGVRIPNTAPYLAYTIPTPPIAKAQAPWSFIIDADNFVDPDRDALSYSASRANGEPLPTWLSFNAARRMFTGMASGDERGITPLLIKAKDAFGGEARGYFNVTVTNSAPQAEGRIFDQQVSSTESSFTFTVPGFDDPDGDSVSYSAEMIDGSALPSWLMFNPSTRTFSASPTVPTPGNYLINVIATDTLGQSQKVGFNLAIAAPPNIDLSTSTQDKLRQAAPVLGGILLLSMIASMLLWRQRRILNINQRIYSWSCQNHSTSDSSEPVNFSSLSEQVRVINKLLEDAEDLAKIELAMLAFEHRLRLYYAQPIKHTSMTTLLDTHIVEKLMKFVERNILEIHHSDYDSAMTLGSARLLHNFIGMILSEHTGRKHKLTTETKELYLNRLNRLISRMNPRSNEAVAIMHELHSAREALICIADTNTLLLLCKTSFTHLLSPGALLKDIKRLAFDIPSTWYIQLLELSVLVNKAKTDITALSHLQAIAAKETDWRFRYGMIKILLNIITHSADQAIRNQAILGKNTRFGITLLGLIHLLKHQTVCCYHSKYRWVDAEAKSALEQTNLSDQDKRLLRPYVTASAISRAARASMLATPLDAKSPRVISARKLVNLEEPGVIMNPLRNGNAKEALSFAEKGAGTRNMSSPMPIPKAKGTRAILSTDIPDNSHAV